MTIRSTNAAGAFLACNVYVDGQYIRSQLRSLSLPDEFDPRPIAVVLVSGQKIRGSSLAVNRIFYYDALDEQDDPARGAGQQAYLERVNQLPDTHVVTGFVRQGRRNRREQKAVDVRLAVDALEAAWSGTTAVVGIVSGDADFAPLADAVRRAGQHVIVGAFKNHLSTELRDAADRLVYLQDPPHDHYSPLV